MLNYLKKFALDIFPSVAATIIGAYIVNHYIVTRPGADAPVAAAVSASDPKAPEIKPSDIKPAEIKPSDAKPAEAADVGNLPTAGVKARGVSEKAMMERTAAERPTVIEKAQDKAQGKAEEKAEAKAEAKPDAKAEAKSADAPVETASVPADQRRHTAAPREKVRVVLPSLVQPVTPAAAPVAAVPAPPVEAAAAPEERRDANDLARAAIERWRGNGEAPRVQETSRQETSRIDASRAVTAPAAAAPAVRPLPPPIMVSAPPTDSYYVQGSSQPRPPYAANPGVADPGRPTPPAEIPGSRPLDLRAEAAEPTVRDRTTAVAEDVLSTAKSLFHAVLPK